MGKLEGKTAVITGATSGIGAATAKLFAKEGASVILLGRNKDRGGAIEYEIKTKGHKAEFMACDVTSLQNIIIIRDKIEEKYKKVDILFNNAGIFVTQELKEIDVEAWKNTFQTNVDSVMYMTKSFMDLLIKCHGNIINNVSISGLDSYTAGRKNYIYASSKAAVIKFTKLCALNYAKEVRVNCICPGIIDTEIYTNRDFSRFHGTIPMGYVGDPLMVAKAVLFLASDDASYITGVALPVDGGAALI